MAVFYLEQDPTSEVGKADAVAMRA